MVSYMSAEAAQPGSFEPRIVAFLCKWCTYAGADLAGTSRMVYPPNVRTIMLPCTGRIDIAFVLRAFLQGADGVLVSGCHPGDCHYTAGNYRARRRWILLRDLLDTLGFDLGRLELAWISAAEGAKFVKTVESFTQRVKDLGPYHSMRRVAEQRLADAAPDMIADTPVQPAAQEPAPADPALIAAATEALNDGKVKAVVGWIRNWTLKRPRATWLTAADEVKDLIAPATTPGNLARFLTSASLASFSPAGIVARRGEMLAINVLLQEQQIDPAKIVVFAIDEAGKFLGTMDLDTAAEALVNKSVPPSSDEPSGFSPELFKQLDELMAKPAEARWDFWAGQFARCVKCYACRGACPMCSCDTCFFDRNQPQWFPTAADGPGNFAWQVIRAFHLSGRCVGCGACQGACPAGIPLNLLGAAMARSSLNNFGHRAGADPEAPPLQADFKPDDKESFIL